MATKSLTEKLWKRKTLTAALLLLLLSLLFMNVALFPREGLILGGHDMRGYYFVLHNVVREGIRSGHLPFWEPGIFNGFPILADPQTSAFYPPAWLFIILPLNIGISWYMLLHIWLAGLGMYTFVRFLGGRWLPAVLAGIVFSFSGLLAGRLWAGHSTVYAIDSWTPWLLLALAWCVRRRTWWAAVIAGLPMGLAILAGHLPSFLYVILIWGGFLVYLLITEKEGRAFVIRQAAIMFGIGLGIAAVQLVPFLQFSLTSQRIANADYEFATDYSLPPAHLITLVIPEFFGEPTRVGYWSVPTFEELTYYGGILAILGIVLGLSRPTRLTWFYIFLMIFGLWLALGRYGVLYKLFYNLFPPFRIVRAPGRAAFLYLFAAAGLLGHALSNWKDSPYDHQGSMQRVLRWTFFLVLVVGFTALAATGAVFMAVHPTETSGRLWHQIGGYSIALVIFVFGIGLIGAYLRDQGENRTKYRLVAIGLIIIAVADMWLFSNKFVRLETSAPEDMWSDAKSVIDESNARVLPWGVSLFSQNGGLIVGLDSVFGYDSLEPAAHIDLTSSVPDPRSTAYDVLAVNYVISPVALEQFEEGDAGLNLVANHGNAWIYHRPGSLAEARLVYEVEVISDNSEAIAKLHQPEFDPAKTAIFDKAPTCQVGPAPSSPGLVEILKKEPGYWKIRTMTQEPALLILAETAYPGWEVLVDGQQADSYKAYTTIKSVCVPSGEHLVEWRFVPTVYLVGGLITFLVIAVAIIAGVKLIQRKY